LSSDSSLALLARRFQVSAARWPLHHCDVNLTNSSVASCRAFSLRYPQRGKEGLMPTKIW